jgi:hypothetical protein
VGDVKREQVAPVSVISFPIGSGLMSATIEFFKAWMRENIGTLPANQEISISVLARQFEDDATAAGYGSDVREDEIGDVETAMAQEIAASRFMNEPTGISPRQ